MDYVHIKARNKNNSYNLRIYRATEKRLKEVKSDDI
jgi:hypothetical protein